MSNVSHTRETAISCDILVVGGGAAGVGAAIAAGRVGAQVVLLERYGFLGGLATAAQVGTICGLYLRETVGVAATPVGGGFPQEFASHLQRESDTRPIRVTDTGLWVLPYSPPAFARAADTIVSESKNIAVTLHATVAGVRAENSQLNEVRAIVWNEPILFHPKTIVDCTGEATAAVLAGANAENGGADQAPALVFVLGNVDAGLAQRGLLEVRRELHRAVAGGTLPALCERLSLVPGTGANGRLAFKLSLLPADPEHTLWQQVTNWEREARALLEPLRRFLVDHIPSCRNATLDSVAPQLGVRSGRRILGRTRLADKDVLATRKFLSGIARGAWPMERWTNSPRPEMTYFKEGEYYEIPFDCLRPVELDNVWVAGRCLSAQTGAMTSARVIGTALATGWAAGTAAAFQAAGRSVNDTVTEIRRAMHQ